MKKKSKQTEAPSTEITETQVELPKRKHKISKQTRNYIIYTVLIVAVTALTLYFLLKNDPMAVIDALRKAEVLPVLAIVGLVLLAICIEGLILMIITKMYNKKYHVYHGVVNGLIGSFFSNVTPFASGGQFVQAYTFTRQGVRAAHAASILVMHFIVYQSVLLIYALVAFFAGFNVIGNMKPVDIFGIKFTPILLSVAGFIINGFTIISLFILAYCRPLHRLILNTGINIGAKLHLVKNPEAKRMSLTASVATFRVEFKRLFSNFKVVVPVFILFIAKFTVLYSIPYFCGLAMDIDMSGKYFDSLFSSSYLTMITSFVPIPGGSGGAEWGFQMLFTSIYQCSSDVLNACILLWRGVSYYVMTLIGGVTFALYRGKPKVKTDKVADTQTFKDLDLTPFIKHAGDFEMLERKYSKMDDKKARKKKGNALIPENIVEDPEENILSQEEVIESFAQINDQLSVRETPQSDNKELDNITSKYLKQVVEETIAIEESQIDPEVTKAIEEDRRILEEDRIRREKRKLAKKNKKLNKKQKQVEEPKTEPEITTKDSEETK